MEKSNIAMISFHKTTSIHLSLSKRKKGTLTWLKSDGGGHIPPSVRPSANRWGKYTGSSELVSTILHIFATYWEDWGQSLPCLHNAKFTDQMRSCFGFKLRFSEVVMTIFHDFQRPMHLVYVTLGGRRGSMSRRSIVVMTWSNSFWKLWHWEFVVASSHYPLKVWGFGFWTPIHKTIIQNIIIQLWRRKGTKWTKGCDCFC